jgi:pimeloyl-ACP methyl ester carboxylesterase
VAFDVAGEGPAVLLIHAFGFDADMWGPQIEALVPAGYTVITPDVRGFGASPDPPAGFTFPSLVDELVGVLDEAGAAKAVVVGLSMGAAMAVSLALDHPERVAGLLLADNARPDGPERASAAAERIRTLGLIRLADVYEEILFGRRFRETATPALARWRERLIGRDAEVLAVMVERYHTRPDPGPRLGEIRVPTEIVFGADDAAVPPERRSDYLAIDGATAHELPGTGHLSNLESPAEFNAVVFALLDAVARRREAFNGHTITHTEA